MTIKAALAFSWPTASSTLRRDLTAPVHGYSLSHYQAGTHARALGTIPILAYGCVFTGLPNPWEPTYRADEIQLIEKPSQFPHIGAVDVTDVISHPG